MNETDNSDTERCLRRECRSTDVDVSPADRDRVHISCNECGWLHRFVHVNSERYKRLVAPEDDQ